MKLIVLYMNCIGNWLTNSISFFSNPVTFPFRLLVEEVKRGEKLSQ